MTEERLVSYERQEKIFNPVKQKSNILVFGAGSTGSFITLNLAKLGFNNITVFDFDVVEKQNIPNQFYRVEDIGEFKVVALQDIVQSFTGINIAFYETKITKDNVNEIMEENVDLNTVVVLCFDNMEARKLVFEAVKRIPIKLVDTRMGADSYAVYAFDLSKKEDVEGCAKRLEEQTADTLCGEKSVIYTVLSIASETCQIVKGIDKGEEYFKVIKRSMPSLKVLGK